MKVAVIGRGLIGSAAARHLAQAGHEVCLIGPSEPVTLADHTGPFASHYDEGRITRSLDPYRFWSKAANASIARYREIERLSGVPFFSEVGVMMAGPRGSEGIGAVAALAAREATQCRDLDDADLAREFPYFAFARDTRGLHEADCSGYISPRSLVRAQGQLAQAAGARIVNAAASGLRETGQGIAVTSDQGSFDAERVLVATGGFSRDLLAVPLELTVYARTVALFEVSAEQAHSLQDMPAMIYLDNGEDPYLLPPIRYPDGRYYLKLGGDPDDVALPDEAATREWFRSGGSEAVGAHLEERFRARMPGVAVRSRHIRPCVTTFTPENIPALTQNSDRVFTAIGGCGRAAKSSDEIGRLAGELVLGNALPEWAYEAAL